MGDAVTTTLLLSDWTNYGLSERVCYHFDLTEALGTSPVASRPATSLSSSHRKNSHSSTGNNNDEEEGRPKFENVCGVVKLLECVPFTPLNRLTKRQKRALRNDIRDFNLDCMRARDEKRVFCHEPPRLPLRMNPASRLFFAYEVTRMVFCLDASPTLTSTFGGSMDGNDSCCPMDRVASMTKTFFKALVEPIDAPSIPIHGVWRPEIDVTVIAVYPRATGLPQTSLLVRDFQVHDLKSAELLAKNVEQWCLGEVESEIARRLAKGNPAGRANLLAGYDAWSIPLHSSSLRDILDAGDVSLSILSSVAKPCIVVATDGRSVSCDGVMDILADADRSDVPLVVLDLSSPQSHSQRIHVDFESGKFNEPGLMQYDPGGPCTFPLHLSDDTEALHGICKATGGCFFDAELLDQAAEAKAGQSAESPFSADHYFSFKRRSVRPNAVQWYILFSLSPLSPTFNSAWGKIVPPQYLRRRPLLSAKVDAPQRDVSTERRPPGWSSRFAADNQTRHTITSDVRRDSPFSHRGPMARTTFSTYIVSPIRIKGLLMMRLKEGYRAKQYGQSTQDVDKVLIQFNLPLELGTVLHYELSYKALANQSHMVGVAHIKIELSGESGFIQSVKNDFLRQTHVGRPITMAQQISARLCKILHWIRKEDCLQSYLCPVSWSDQLIDSETPFVRRLRTLTPLQRRRHFRFDQFDVVCTGRMPYAHDDGFLSVFDGSDDGEHELIDAVAEWSTQTILEGRRYVKQTENSDNLASYCVVELSKSPVAARVFTLAVEFFGGTGACDRLEIISSLKDVLSECSNVEVLSKQMGDYVVCLRKHQPDRHLLWTQSLLENQHHHASWDLVKDPELLPLLMKRRAEIGMFKLLESSDDHALFGKLIPSGRSTAEDLIQYQIAILSDRVVIDFHMESSCGEFFPFRNVDGENEKNLPQFHRMAYNLRRRDQECAHALRCRTSLLMALEGGPPPPDDANLETHTSCVKQLLPYASKLSRKLRFFHSGSGNANDVLQGLSEDLLLSNSFGVQVARLSVGADEGIGDTGRGTWFIIRFDRHTMSIVHHSLLDQYQNASEEAESFTYRELTFFTLGVSDLYSTRDDVADDDSADSHISEYLAMIEFADLLDAAHKNNYASAAYLALKWGNLPVNEVQHDDLEKVLDVCEFIEVASVIVAGNPAQSDSSKLQELVATVLGQVTICDHSDHCLFYYTRTDQEDLVYRYETDADSLSAYEEMDAVAEGDIEYEESDQGRFFGSLDDFAAPGGDFGSRSDEGLDRALVSGDDSRRNLDDDPLSGPLYHSGVKAQLNPPLFVRFTLDGEVASMRALASIKKSSTLTAHVSVFRLNGKKTGTSVLDTSPQLSGTHTRAAVELNALLNAYVAEQTLERLRQFGPKLTEDDLKVVKRCLRGARNVVKSKFEVYFYSGKADIMVPAFAPAGGEAAIEDGLALLMKELQKNDTVTLKAFTGDVFVAMESADESCDALEFWCFITIRRTNISVKVHHPQGVEQANNVTSRVQDMILRCCHRVNQQLLLRRLHQSRTASELLIPKDAMVLEEPDEESEQLFRPGVFGCPVVFRTSFDLFHRCATNPGQVARKLEGTVLHSFAVSNRRNVFVYKDETGDVFYMMLVAHGGGVEPNGTVELLVYGIQEPGPSITSQLAQLLQRRILLIAVDMLSSVLTKNPHFHWKRADLDFIFSFENEWKSLDENYKVEPTAQEVDYEFPEGFIDPGIILLYFRQNLCGSTFFHRLNEVSDAGSDYVANLSQEEEINFDVHDFTFYYNNNPSKLDPKFQSISTLTEKGAAYCRQAGTGIAIIKVSLVYSTGDPVGKIRFGVPLLESESVTDVSLEKLRMCQAKSGCETPSQAKRSIRVRVSITGTALKLAGLHGWVLLTLNQSFASWCTEKHLERMQRNLLKVGPNVPLVDEKQCTSDALKKTKIDRLCPGLPALSSLLEKTCELPHPAYAKNVGDGIIRASSVASVTLDLLETIVTMSNNENKKTTGSTQIIFSDISIIRLSRSEKPRRVMLDYDTNGHDVLVRVKGNSGNNGFVRDKSIDCPEYICFYCDPKYAGGNKEGKKRFHHPQLFREIVVADGNSDKSTSIAQLEKLKQKHPNLFYQSFSFIFAVKRNSRVLLTYNWTPVVVKNVASRMLEKDSVILRNAGRSMDSLQLRTLNLLSPPTAEEDNRKAVDDMDTSGITASVERGVERKSSRGKDAKPSEGSNDATENVTSAASSAESGRKVRISRPTNIRRPKLVGKSVEGAAMHAVAASRARASNKQRFARGNASVSTTQSQKSQPDDPKKDAKKEVTPKKDDTKKSSFNVAKKQVRRAPTDEAFIAARSRFGALVSANAAKGFLLSSQHRDALQRLVGMWWPSKGKSAIPRTVGDYVLSKAPRAWNDARELPPVPHNLLKAFALSLAQTISMWAPSISLLPVPPRDIAYADSVLLIGEMKTIRSCKCVTVFKVSTSAFGAKGRKKDILRSEGWVMTLPRHHASEHRHSRSPPEMNLSCSERDSAALDKLTTDLHAALNLDCLIFDFIGFTVERVMKSLDNRLSDDEIIPMIRSLLLRYPLHRQTRKLSNGKYSMTKLNYRAFKANIVLTSYENRLINFFPAPMLYDWLDSHAKERGLVKCGGDGLCFKKEVVIENGINSIAFLTCDKSEPQKMELLILCRTQGKSLHTFMFRKGSSVAISILDNIAVEVAELAYQELRAAATDLRLSSLWTKVSKMAPKRSERPTKDDIDELLFLAKRKPLLREVDRRDTEKVTMIMQSGIDWKTTCLAMEDEPSFSPAHVFQSGASTFHLFYLREDDLFLLFQVNKLGTLLSLDFVMKHEEEVSEDMVARVIQKLMNYVLHFLWFSI